MRLFNTVLVEQSQTFLVTALGWNCRSELYFSRDDFTIWRWDSVSEVSNKLCTLNSFVTTLQWCPSTAHPSQNAQGKDVFVVACTDGTFRILNKDGKEEKKVEAHEGAVLSLHWNFQGTALATGGEDGKVKTWSCSGVLQSILAQIDCHPIHALAWSPKADHILISCGKNLMLKTVQLPVKHILLQGHEGLVLAIDWSPVNNLIISSGEDCQYKVWDQHGCLLYQSEKADYRITSVAWCPSGELFIAGSFNSVYLCDKNGWPLLKEKTSTGSLLKLAWSKIGIQLAAAGGNGSLIICEVVERRIEWKALVAILKKPNQIQIQNIFNKTVEDIHFRERIVSFGLAFDYLIVVTSIQCFIYSSTKWSMPHFFDTKNILLLKQCQNHFLLLDPYKGMQIFTYEGRFVTNLKFQGHLESLSDSIVSLSNDFVAILDTSNHCMIQVFEVITGKPLMDSIRHTLDIISIALNQVGSESENIVAFIDSNQELFMSPIHKQESLKLASMVGDIRWNSSVDILAAIASHKLLVWHYPSAAYVDKDLLRFLKIDKDCDSGEHWSIQSFNSSQCILHCSSGQTRSTFICPYLLPLFEHVTGKKWGHAIHLCRYLKEKLLWACLTALALKAKELMTAKEGYAALGEVVKVQFLSHLERIPLESIRQAKVALFYKKPEEAESILLQNNLVFHALKMHIRLFNWDRALELALSFHVHVDTILRYRQQYLARLGLEESKAQFINASKQQVPLDITRVQEKIHEEKPQEQCLEIARGIAKV